MIGRPSASARVIVGPWNWRKEESQLKAWAGRASGVTENGGRISISSFLLSSTYLLSLHVR